MSGNQYFLVLFQSFLVSWTKGFKSSGGRERCGYLDPEGHPEGEGE